MDSDEMYPGERYDHWERSFAWWPHRTTDKKWVFLRWAQRQRCILVDPLSGMLMSSYRWNTE